MHTTQRANSSVTVAGVNSNLTPFKTRAIGLPGAMAPVVDNPFTNSAATFTANTKAASIPDTKLKAMPATVASGAAVVTTATAGKVTVDASVTTALAHSTVMAVEAAVPKAATGVPGVMANIAADTMASGMTDTLSKVAPKARANAVTGTIRNGPTKKVAFKSKSKALMTFAIGGFGNKVDVLAAIHIHAPNFLITNNCLVFSFKIAKGMFVGAFILLGGSAVSAVPLHKFDVKDELAQDSRSTGGVRAMANNQDHSDLSEPKDSSKSAVATVATSKGIITTIRDQLNRVHSLLNEDDPQAPLEMKRLLEDIQPYSLQIAGPDDGPLSEKESDHALRFLDDVTSKRLVEAEVPQLLARVKTATELQIEAFSDIESTMSDPHLAWEDDADGPYQFEFDDTVSSGNTFSVFRHPGHPHVQSHLKKMSSAKRQAIQHHYVSQRLQTATPATHGQHSAVPS